MSAVASSQAPDYDKRTQRSVSVPVPVVSDSSRKTKLHQFSPKEVAEELSLMDAELLRKIASKELENGTWMKKDKFSLAPNVLAMVHASNDLAMLVPTEILSEVSTHAMAKCISTYIKIAGKCYRLKNFNSLKAILAGLQCTPIYRLKRAWREVSAKRKKKFDTLSGLMSEEHNWNAYTQHLEDTLDKNTPCIPFLGVLLTMIVQYESVHAVHADRRPSRSSRAKKISGVEDYTLLEAITVRNRLESIRKRSSSWRMSLPCLDQSTSVHNRQVSYPDDHSITTPELENSRPRANALILLDEDTDSDNSCSEKTVTMATILEEPWVGENGDDKRFSLISSDRSDTFFSSSTNDTEQRSNDDELMENVSPGACVPSKTKISLSQIDVLLSGQIDHDINGTPDTVETNAEHDVVNTIDIHEHETLHNHQSRKLDEDSNSSINCEETTVTLADAWSTDSENGNSERLSPLNLLSSLSSNHSDVSRSSSSSTDDTDHCSSDDDDGEPRRNESPGACVPSNTKVSVSQIDVQLSGQDDHDDVIASGDTECRVESRFNVLFLEHSDYDNTNPSVDTEHTVVSRSNIVHTQGYYSHQLSGQDDHDDVIASGDTNTECRVESRFNVLFLEHSDHDNTNPSVDTEHTVVSRSNTVHTQGYYSHQARHKKTRSRKLSEIEIKFDSDDEIVYTLDKVKNSEHLLHKPVELTPSRSYDGLIDACANWNFDKEENHFLNPVVAAASLDSLRTLSSTSVSTTESSDSSSSQSTSSLLSNIIQNVSGGDQDSRDDHQPLEKNVGFSNSQRSHPLLSRSSTEYDIIPPMRCRSRVVNDFYRTGDQRAKTHLPRTSTNIIVPSKQLLERRRRASPLISVLQATTNNLSDPSKLLSRYQLMSFGCSDGIRTNSELRKILSQAPRNTEGQNYKLSYLKEPA